MVYIYKWYILPIGGLYATYHLLREPETTIEKCRMPCVWTLPTAKLSMRLEMTDHSHFPAKKCMQVKSHFAVSLKIPSLQICTRIKKANHYYHTWHFGVSFPFSISFKSFCLVGILKACHPLHVPFTLKKLQ